MSTVAEDRTKLIMDIINTDISMLEVKKRISELETKYGDLAFISFDFQKESAPWTMEYFNDLKQTAMAGGGSKEFIIHLAEVKQSLSISKNEILPKVYLTVGVVIFLVVLIFTGAIFEKKYDKAANKDRLDLITIIAEQNLPISDVEKELDKLVKEHGHRAFGKNKLNKQKNTYTDEYVEQLNNMIIKYNGKITKDSILFYTKVINEYYLIKQAQNARIELFNKISSSNLSTQEINKLIKNNERAFGNKAFVDMKFDKKKSSWTLDDLDLLTKQIKNLNGNYSKEYLMYYIQVREYVQKIEIEEK
ncbi:MAG: hypothetical protein MR739_04215 [Spirochaetia bacterium]|nr:hypothetical protein [Spirochaetia bacterium]